MRLIHSIRQWLTKSHNITKLGKHVDSTFLVNQLLIDMYNDDYFPNQLVDKVKDELMKVIVLLETGEQDVHTIQSKLDEVTLNINALQAVFEENDSEIETAARDSIGLSVELILEHFHIDIDPEEAIRYREW
ncbi:MAG: DUF5713 family protein [Aerococcaceae bacterium]|nr:DUF5713 family protein [Aerococcaceae bacterium]